MKLFRIWEILNKPRLITTVEFLSKLDSFARKNGLSGPLSVMKDRATYFENDFSTRPPGRISEARLEQMAFIQFSSGSTGDPKGVVITHQNVLANLYSIIRWSKIDEQDSNLNWMPLTHDMGLIGAHIKATLAGINQYNIETPLFIRHPALWIKKSSEHRVTLLYSPNFGYKYLLKFHQPNPKLGWDLSNVRLLYNGAEPISVQLCNEFLNQMAPYGLKRKAMHPVYGLAEGTSAVTLPYPGKNSDTSS